MNETQFAFEIDADGQLLSLKLLDELINGTRLHLGLRNIETIEIIWPQKQQDRFMVFGSDISTPMRHQGINCFVNEAVSADEVHSLVILKGKTVKSRIKGLSLAELSS